MAIRTIFFSFVFASVSSLWAQVPQHLYYRFNEGTGPTTDNSAFPGSGNPTMGVPGSWTSAGKINACIDFQGGATGPASGTGWMSNFSNNQSWTVEFWMNSSSSFLEYVCGVGSLNEFRIVAGGGNNLKLRSRAVGGFDELAIPGNILDGNWHHAAFVFDSVAKTATAYLDGQQVAQNVNQTVGTIVCTSQFLVGGAAFNNASYSGLLDEFRFWGVARTQAEIAANMNVELFLQPTASVTATPGSTQNVYAHDQGPTGNGRLAGRFEIATGPVGPVGVTEVQLSASGTGDDSTAFSEIAIYRDANNNTFFDPGVDILVASTPGGFISDDGVKTLSVLPAEQPIPANTTVNYLVVTKLAGTALPGQTFDFAVSDLTVPAGLKTGLPSAVMSGFLILTPSFVVTDQSAPAALVVAPGSGNVCQRFSINYVAGPPDKPSTITVTAMGTGDDVAHLADVGLWYDADASGTFSATSDTLVDAQVFGQDNGDVVFSMAGHPAFQQGQTRRFFVIYNIAANAADQATFKCYVSAVGPASYGALFNGIPAPGAGGTAGLVVSAPKLVAALNGPFVASAVDNTYQGPAGDGALICDVTLNSPTPYGWVVADLSFLATGTGNSDSAFSQVALHEDTGNGTWGGTAADPQAAPLGGFSLGAATFALTNTTLVSGASRRFFLVGKLNGTALAGETFNARLVGVGATPQPGGVQIGIPTGSSTALVISAAALTVHAGPTQPPPTVHVAGSAQEYALGQLQFTASNSPSDVTAVTLTADGTGDWLSDVDAASGVRVLLDNGDGVFSEPSDTLLFQGGGASQIAASFSTPVNVPNAGFVLVWLRVGLTATAGSGLQVQPETFRLRVASASAVTATPGIAVVLGTPAPVSLELGAIEFFVTSLFPTATGTGGGAPITITGSGLLAPFSVRIDGTLCPGTAIITGGTTVTGLTVPPGTGKDLPIEVRSGNLPPLTLATTFSYQALLDTGSKDSSSGCSVARPGLATAVFWAPVVIALAGVGRRHRVE